MSNNGPRKPFKSTQSVPLEVGPDADDDTIAPGTRAQMLVIDADEEIRRSVVAHFRAKGWSVHTGATTQEAIDLTLDWQPEVIVVDLFMPNVNGQHLVRTLRGTIEHDVRIIGLATTSEVMFERARQAAVEIVLPKPLDLAAVDAFLAATKPR